MKPALLLLNKSHFKFELQALGHPVYCAVPRSEISPSRTDAWSLDGYDYLFDSGITLTEILEAIPFTPQRIIYYDDSHPSFQIKEFHQSPVPIAFYSVDSHVHHLWHPPQCGVFDLVFVAQKDHIPEFAAFCPNCKWLPLWAPFDCSTSSERNIEVSFRGNLDPIQRKKRLAFLEALSMLVPLNYSSGPYKETYANSKIVINESIKSDVNFRVFETLMSGAMLLTGRVGNGLLELFKENEHFVVYEDGDPKDAAKKIRYYLEHEAERMAIANAGRQEVLIHHTRAARAHTVSEQLSALTVSGRHYQYYSLAYQELFEASENLKKGIPVSSDCIQKVYVWLSHSIERKELCDFILIHAVASCAEVLQRVGLADLAVALTQAATKSFPHEPTLNLLLIEALQRCGKKELALHQCLYINPNNPEVVLDSLPTLLGALRANRLFFNKAPESAPRS